MNSQYDNIPPLQRLKAIMARLRRKDGCQWDQAQTHTSLLPYLIEESYEVVEAIEQNRLDDLKEELGDLLTQVYFHAQIADEEGRFSIDDVAEVTAEKLIRRHPHVFGEKKALNPSEVRDQWERIKVESKEKPSVLSGVPTTMPALLLAYRVGEKAAGVGFDWNNPRDIFDKFREEIAEFEKEFGDKNKDGMTHELGDLIFALVNLARKTGIDPEYALRQTVGRFIERFEFIEKSLKRQGKSFSETSLEEMEALWQQAKK